MQNLVPKLRQTKKTGILSEKLETLTSSNYHRFQYFLLKLCTHFLLSISVKGCVGFFKILFISWFINKSVKNECVGLF